jgi:hypothetical protein
MKINKVFLSLTLGLGLAVTPTATYAIENGPLLGAGTWDPVGTSTFSFRSATVNSGGGDFKACLVSGTGSHPVQLWEEDVFASDKIGSPQTLSYIGDCAVWSGIGSGSELFLGKDTSGTIKVQFYD